MNDEAALSSTARQALIRRLTALADDELVLSHRNGEWIGHAPILEEDIALANLAQDELGHALVWLGLRGELDGSDPDGLAYRREAGEFLSARLLELPRGDWAFTLLRQFLFDAYEAVWLGAARESTYRPLREAVAKVIREERFHLQHTRLWVDRLGLGTPESRRRTQAALDTLWPLAWDLFLPLPDEAGLVESGAVPDVATLLEPWRSAVAAHLEHSGLRVPPAHGHGLPRGVHSEHLAPLLREMQAVARLEAEATAW